MSEKETKETVSEIIKRTQWSIGQHIKDGEDMDSASWNYQEGILFSANDAKLLLDHIKALEINVKQLSKSLNDCYKKIK